MTLTQDKLHQLFKYDPETGYFYHLVSHSRVKQGNIAGGINGRKYWAIGIGGKRYLAHRLAWLYMTGSWPKDGIDHINHITTDNRWTNLREATHAQNMRNARRHRKNKSGIKGVYWIEVSRKWGAAITVNKKLIYLGCHADKNIMAERYKAAAQQHFGEFSFPHRE